MKDTTIVTTLLGLFLIIKKTSLLTAWVRFIKFGETLKDQSAFESAEAICDYLKGLSNRGYHQIPIRHIRKSNPLPLIRCRPRLIGSIK